MMATYEIEDLAEVTQSVDWLIYVIAERLRGQRYQTNHA